MDFGPVEPGNLGGAQFAKSGDGEVGNHGFAVAPFAAFLDGREAGVEQFAKFKRVEDFDLAAVIVCQLDGVHFVVVFGKVTAFDGESEQGVDELAIVVLCPPCDAQTSNVVFDLFAGDEGNADVEGFGKLAEASAEFLDVNLALASLFLRVGEFVHNFLNGLLRQADGMTFDVKVNRFLEAGVLRQPANRGNVISNCEVEIGVGFPFAELLHRADVIGAVVALEFEGLGFAVGELDRDEFGFLPWLSPSPRISTAPASSLGSKQPCRCRSRI